ncbi:hypothetical protein EYF80_018956 [Liparis tanakae]|uniref:Uncharacterized protein n=1 Tax=Liparis tanakae TaxID=230148 RepID=A0A4Z2I0R1_9TELE|nr:hypothetical protein EYF80_018956 [Liparis tanakae]
MLISSSVMELSMSTVRALYMSVYKLFTIPVGNVSSTSSWPCAVSVFSPPLVLMASQITWLSGATMRTGVRLGSRRILRVLPLLSVTALNVNLESPVSRLAVCWWVPLPSNTYSSWASGDATSYVLPLGVGPFLEMARMRMLPRSAT